MARSPVNPLVSDPSVTVVVWTGALSALAALQAENARLRAELSRHSATATTRHDSGWPNCHSKNLLTAASR